MNKIYTFPNSLHLFIKQFMQPYKLYLLLIMFIDIFIAFYIPIQSYIIKKLVDATIPMLGKTDLIKVVLLPSVCLFICTLLNLLSWRFNNYLNLKYLPALKADIIDAASSCIRLHSFKFFQNNFSGSISNRIIDLTNNTELLINNFRSLFRTLLIITGAILMALLVNIFFSVIFLMASVFVILSSIYISKKINIVAKEFSNNRSNVIGNVIDNFANIINIILFARESYERAYLKKHLEAMVQSEQDLQKKLMEYGFGMTGLSMFIQSIIIISLVYLGSKGSLTAGDFILIFMLTFSVLDHVWVFSDTLFILEEKLGIFKRALQLISMPRDITEIDQAKSLIVNKGVIVFSRVDFFHFTSQHLFKDKTLVIKGGERVGLVGYSGSGKSSFVNLIIRMYDIHKGNIFIDDQSVRLVTLKSLRENIGFIPQEPTLFHRTIMENIKYGKLTATDEEVIAAAKATHIHEFVQKLPQGYYSMVGERGIKLSGGQRQLIAIARVILKNAPILILDEATSSLDSITESFIKESLELAMRNKTVIVVAHRLSTIKSLDRILVFDKGKIVEEGTHDYLLLKGKVYKDLWRIQEIN